MPMTIDQRQQQAARILHAAGILPVVTVDGIEQAKRLADALLAGGLRSIELTLRTPTALDALAALKRSLPELVVGAGTVLHAGQVRQSIDAGADFLVTPGTPPELAAVLAQAPIPVVPGGATPSEFLALMRHGFRVCKLFPAVPLGGINMLKALAGPLAGLQFCPTGGIGEGEAGAFLAQPNVLCIGGSWMVPKAWLADSDYARIRASAASAAALVARIRGGG
ncbi:bifunctional 4-hydroxy-2-oxoglutarate aldolase/2-dehydro-3-deoxy-phosphogluconate aldolase [soil metagenome]